jgi:hypothetical protein
MCFFNETHSDESIILLHHYLDTIIAGPTKLSFWLIRSQENAPPSKYYIVGKKLLRAYFFVVASIDFVFKYIS